MTIVTSLEDLNPITANTRDFWLGWGTEDRVDDDYALFRSGARHPMLNGILRVDSEHVSDVLRQARRRLCDVPWLWHVGPDSRPDIAVKLLANGAVPVFTVPLMGVMLDRIFAIEGPGKLQLEEAETREDVEDWVRVYGREFGWPKEVIPAAIAMEIQRNDPSGVLRRYTGRIDGRIVGTAAVFVAHGVAGVFCVATAGDWRRRGIGGRMTCAALAEARQRGLSVAVLESSPEGVPLYQRLGFSQIAELRWFQV